jgi:hypothetical protein
MTPAVIPSAAAPRSGVEGPAFRLAEQALSREEQATGCASRNRKRQKTGLRSLVIFLVLLIIIPAHAGKKKQGPDMTVHPGLLAEVADLKVVAAEQPCENFAWAAALETVLAPQQIDLKQDQWLDRVTGRRCEDTAPTLEDTARMFDRDHRDHREKLRVTPTLIAGAPRLLDDILASLQQGRPVLVYWRSHPYVLQGVLYDEAVYPTGNKIFQVRELRLRDPLAPGNGDIKFVRGTDNPDEINGVLMLSVGRAN